MAKTAQLSVTFNLTGDGFGGAAVAMAPAANTNAPPPGAAQLTAGANTVLVPSGYTVVGCVIFPPAASVNSKTLKGVTGDTGITGWSNSPLIVPATAGGTFVIQNVGGAVETCSLLWF